MYRAKSVPNVIGHFFLVMHFGDDPSSLSSSKREDFIDGSKKMMRFINRRTYEWNFRMKIKEKINVFIQKNGYTVKAWMVALVVFPPGALYLPFKMTHLPAISRVGMVIATLVIHISIGIFGGALIGSLFF